jgi:hypothetical protein
MDMEELWEDVGFEVFTAVVMKMILFTVGR